jgi:GNAT superfamily N-acetyltransferase
MRTGPDFSEEHVLDDGTRVTIRHVRPEDADEVARGFARLSPTSRYRRFLGGLGALSPEMLRYLTHVDGKDHVALVAVAPREGGGDEGLGIARFIRDPGDAEVAEAAITVIDEAQRKGLGRILGVALGRAALERGIHRFRGEILTDNGPVRQLLEEVGAVVRPDSGASLGGGGSLVFDLELAPHEAAPERSFDVVVGRLLRSAASQLAGLFRGVGPPHRDHEEEKRD